MTKSARSEKFKRFRADLKLVLAERTAVFFGRFYGTWNYLVARAEARQARQEYEEERARLPPGVNMSWPEVYWYEDRLRALDSMAITSKARKLGVLIQNDWYEPVDNPLTGGHWNCLTEEGMSRILPLIREESRKRRQEFGYWLGLAIGVIGALTGFVAVLK